MAYRNNIRRKVKIFGLVFFVAIIQTIWAQNPSDIESIAKSVFNSSSKKDRKERLSATSDSLRSLASYKTRYIFLKEIIEIAKVENDTSTRIFGLNLLGNVYNSIGKYYEAILVFEEAIKLELDKKASLRDLAALSNIYMNLGNSFFYLEDHDKSLLYYKKSLAELKKMGIVNENHKERFALIYNNLAIAYIQKKNFETGRYYFLQALNIDKEIKDSTRMFNVILNIAGLYGEESNYDSALVLYMRARAYFSRNDVKEDIAYVDQVISSNYYKMRKYDMALKYGSLALKNVDSSDYNSLAIIYSTLSKSYLETNDYKNAYKFQNLHTMAKDSINSAGVLSKIKENQLLTDFSKMRFADSVSADVKLKVSNTKIEEKKKQNYYLIAILILTIAALGVIYNRFNLIKKQKEIISEQKLIVEEKQTEILDSMNYAKRIQNAMLAHKDVMEAALNEHFIMFNPKDIVSGDFYWAAKRDGYFFIALCDSTGHGVPGAFMSLLNISFLGEAINEKGIIEPGKIFDHVRTKLIEHLSRDGQRDGFDGVLIRVDLDKGEIKYAAANTVPVIIRNNEIIEFENDRMPVGLGEIKQVFNTYTFPYQSNDLLYLYTDGFADQFGGPKGKKFKYKQLNELLLSSSKASLSQQKQLITVAFENWKQELEQVDDVSVIGIRL